MSDITKTIKHHTPNCGARERERERKRETYVSVKAKTFTRCLLHTAHTPPSQSFFVFFPEDTKALDNDCQRLPFAVVLTEKQGCVCVTRHSLYLIETVSNTFPFPAPSSRVPLTHSTQRCSEAFTRQTGSDF